MSSKSTYKVGSIEFEFCNKEKNSVNQLMNLIQFKTITTDRQVTKLQSFLLQKCK